jgi:polysaccharide biosynthesis/export protein
MRIRIVIVLLCIAPSFLVFGQEGTVVPGLSAVQTAGQVGERLLLAASSGDYPVTPGDIYRLTFRQANQPVIMSLTAETDFVVNLDIFGKIDARNMTFPRLKREVETRVSEAYPRSTPSLAITATGIFRVQVKGEVPESFFFNGWGLSRLSDAVQGKLGPYSSTRRIDIISSNSTRESYDLFRAWRFGSLSDNPYLEPGDTIEISERGREVRLLGEVKRPGVYQLLPDEGLRHLIFEYGNGFTSRAQENRVKIVRLSRNTQSALFFDAGRGALPGPPLFDADEVVVNKKTIGNPIVFIEGAVLSPVGGVELVSVDGSVEPTSADTAYERIIHEFRPGESLSDAIRSVADRLSPFASLSEAYIVRESADDPIIPANLEKILLDYDPLADIELQAYDRIIIPGNYNFVTVTGGVANPGAYPFVPNQRYQYYLSLAGGVDPGADSSNISVYDTEGNEKSVDRVIQPSDNIHFAPTQITVSGAVAIPGIYPHVAKRKWNYYVNIAGGFTAGGSAETVEMTDIEGRKKALDTEVAPDDSIFVMPSQVTISGAVLNPGAYPYRPNRTWKYYVSIAGGITQGGTQEDVTVAPVSGAVRSTGDFLEPDDNVHVNFAQVTISGAVFAPGSVPYSPRQTYQYYIGQAGGFDQERNRNGKVEVTDVDGKPRWDDDVIQPGDRIFAQNNSFLYNFNTYFPVITGGIMFITTIINLIELLSPPIAAAE